MNADLDGPADTRLMGIVHHALRRDLARAHAVLADPMRPVAERRRALADHLVWMMRFLHEHHESEDNGLYPLVRERNAAAAELLDAMEADHRSILAGMTALERAAERYAVDEGAAAQVLASLEDLEASLLPHLAREEDQMMPVVAATVTEREWRDWDQAYNVGPLGKRELAKRGLWIMDEQPPSDRAEVEALVPAVPRWLILRIGGPIYRRFAFGLWGLSAHTKLRIPLTSHVDVRTPAVPDAVWRVLSDVTRIGEWSQECRSAAWLGGASRAEVGARFRGRNRVGAVRWSRPCTITQVEPGRSLGWRTHGGLYGDSTQWQVDLEPDAGGTRIVQRYRVVRMPRMMEAFVWRALPSHHDREAALRSELERLGEVALASRRVPA